MMKTMRSFLLTGAIALTAMALNTACSERDINPVVDNQSWDVGKIAGEVVGTWYGEYPSDQTVVAHGGKFNGKTLYGNKEVQGYVFNSDGTGICYNYLCNVAGEAIDMFGGQLDSRNGRFTYTTNADSTITITRVGQGNANNPKTWQAALTQDGLKILYGPESFTMNMPKDWKRAQLTDWENKLRPVKARTRADIDTVWVSDHEWYDESFLTDWWHQGSMELSGFDDPVSTPWGDETTNDDFDIPDYQRYYNSPSNGWEMCFCKFNDVQSKSVHYFGLYNKWNGILRVFFYADDKKLTTYGNELMFYFMSNEADTLKTPFYHALPYGIPANHTINGGNLLDDFKLTGSSNSECDGWQWYLSMFSRNTSTNGVTPGWHCFEIDMSAWNPYTSNWATAAGSSNLMTLRPYARETSDITMTGEMTGNVDGSATTYSTEYRQSSSCPTFSAISNVMSDCASTISSANMGLMAGSMSLGKSRTRMSLAGFGAVVGFGSAALTLVSGIFSMVDKSLQEVEEYTDSTTTNLSMTLDCDLDLSGEISKWTNTGEGGVSLNEYNFEKSNSEGTIGKGLWSLDQDPVVYISKEDLLSSQDHYTINASSDGLTLSDFDETETRMVWFLDPTSIKININEEVYHNPKNVKLYVGVGIASDQKLGYTDCYRDLMCLDDRPTFKISKSTSGNVKLNSSSNPRLTQMTTDDYKDLFDEDYHEYFSTDSINCSNTFKVYGPKKHVFGFDRMIFPQVYVPYDGSTIKPVEAPDLYVYMEVCFDCDEGDGVELVKHFIPKIELCTHSEMSEWYDTLKEYVEKSEAGDPIGQLNKPENIDVYDVAAPTLFKPMLGVMKKALGKD